MFVWKYTSEKKHNSITNIMYKQIIKIFSRVNAYKNISPK